MMKILPRHVLEAVSVEMGVTVEMIRGRARWAEHVAARRLFYHACLEFGFSSTTAGRAIDRDHTTVLSVVRLKRLTPEQRETLDRIKELACKIAETKFEALRLDVSKALDRHRASILEGAG